MEVHERVTWPSAGGTYSHQCPQRQADAFLFVRQIPTPPLVGRQGKSHFRALAGHRIADSADHVPLLSAEGRAETGDTEWSTLAKREFLLQCTSAASVRGNTMALNTLRQSWQQHWQPNANTKRGKPHCATLKARLWDEPPQLARALATGF